MIKVTQEGTYTLSETKNQTKILQLDSDTFFAWINAPGIGEILVTSHPPFQIDTTLAIGKYRLYEVEDELNLTDLQHLELMVGQGKWQGYLLPTGLPFDKNIRNRIIPSNEIITKKIS